MATPNLAMTQVSGMSLSELMQHNVQPITNQLALYLSRDKDAVEWGLNMLQANTVVKDTATKKQNPGASHTDNRNGIFEAVLNVPTHVVGLRRDTRSEEWSIPLVECCILTSTLEFWLVSSCQKLCKYSNIRF